MDNGIANGSSRSLFYDGRPWHKRKLADSSASDVLDVLAQVGELINDERFSQAQGVDYALRDLASTCDAFLKLAGARVSAVATV
ncbi:MAG: hypothetical protein II381_05755 [Victivallales bacterium]|nr:hypothetical protein [Victivallales bacterium]